MQFVYEFDARYSWVEKLLMRALTQKHIDYAFSLGIPDVASLKCTFVFTPDPIPVSEIGMNVLAYEMNIFNAQAMTEIRMKYSMPLGALAGFTLNSETELIAHEIAHAIFAIMKYTRQLLTGTVDVGEVRRYSNNQVHVIANNESMFETYVKNEPLTFRYFKDGVIYTFNGYMWKWNYVLIDMDQPVIDAEFERQKPYPQRHPLYF